MSGTPAQIAFVDAVSARLNFELTVTSWGRTPLEQADAMLVKHEAAGGGAAGDKELHDTYRADKSIDTLLALSPRDAATWADWISKYGMNLSRHLGAKAVDFRTRGLSRAQVDALAAAITAEGGRPLEEDTPPHMHADLPPVEVL